MKIIGITGGSGTGKSTVSEIFQKKGAFIVNADEVYKRTIKKGMPALLEIRSTFGNGVITENGELCRKALAKIVFNSPEQLHKLDLITHKYIIAEIKEEIKNTKSDIIVIDAPTLFESGLDSICHYTVGVVAKKDLRIKRVMERDGLSENAAKERIFAQKEDCFYKEKCDFCIENNEDLTSLIIDAEQIIKEVCSE